MKRLLLSVLLLSALFANAQITLLHTFEEDGVSACSPTIVEDVGIYCYTTDSIDDPANNYYHYTTFYYYDSEFNLYWSRQFQVERYSGISLFPTRHLIDADDGLEFIVNESSSTMYGTSVHSYIMEEDGTIIYDFTNGDNNSFEFKLVNNEIRLLRSVGYHVGSYTADDMELEIYGTGGNYSAEEFQLVTNSAAYPNPARSNIALPYELADGETATMSIYSVNGQLIERFEIGSHFKQVQLNVNSYSPGIYLYEYKGRSNKFIVQ